jgi:hypothetical protein
MLFNGQQLPMPMEATPEEGTVVYVPEPSLDQKYSFMVWDNSSWQEKMLKKGLINGTKETAIEWANAMIPFNNK